MTEPTEPTGTNESPKDPLTDEFRSLGNNLLEMVRAAWERPERKTFQKDLETGITELGNSLRQVAQEVDASEIGQQVRTEYQHLRSQVQSGEMEETLRREMQTALQSINTELQKLTRKISIYNQESEPNSPDEPGKEKE